MALLTMRYGFGQDTAIAKSHPLNLKPTTDFDQRFYYTPGERQNVWGYRAGVLIHDTYKLGIGGYYMNQQSDQGVATTSLTRTSTDAIMVNKKLYLGTVYYEPYVMRRTLWESSLVFETGYGRTVNSSTSKTDNSTLTKQNALFIPAGIGLSVNLKLPPLFHIQCFRWAGINAMVGYRAAIYRQDKQYKYNGAYWSLSGAIFLDRLFEDYHAWKRQRAIVRDSRIIHLSY
ncbi:MAG: hypothetical protein ABJB86_10545 [Bacteroidota bacterium]